MGLKCHKIRFKKLIVYFSCCIYSVTFTALPECFYLLLKSDCFVYTKYIEYDLSSSLGAAKYLMLFLWAIISFSLINAFKYVSSL